MLAHVSFKLEYPSKDKNVEITPWILTELKLLEATYQLRNFIEEIPVKQILKYSFVSFEQ